MFYSCGNSVKRVLLAGGLGGGLSNKLIILPSSRLDYVKIKLHHVAMKDNYHENSISFLMPILGKCDNIIMSYDV